MTSEGTAVSRHTLHWHFYPYEFLFDVVVRVSGSEPNLHLIDLLVLPTNQAATMIFLQQEYFTADGFSQY